MKNILLVVTCLILFSCNQNKDEIYIYYFPDPFTTINGRSCDEIFGFYGLEMVKLNNKLYTDSIYSLVGSLKASSQLNISEIDYKIILKNDTICMDSYGRLKINNQKYFIDENMKLTNYINYLTSKHKDKATKKTDSF